MTLETFQNQENNISIRNKLNLTIEKVNSLTSLVDNLIENGIPASSSTIPIQIDYEGEWIYNTQILSVPPSAMSFFPSDITVTSNLCWVTEININEWNPPRAGIENITFTNLGGVVEDCRVTDLSTNTFVSFPELKVVGEDFYLVGQSIATEFFIPKLEVVGETFQISYCDELTQINVPNLKRVGYMNFEELPKVTDINLPEIIYINYIYIRNNSELININFPNLEIVGDETYIQENSNLRNFHFENIKMLSGCNIGNLTSFSYGDNLLQVRGDQRFELCELDSESVNNILTTLVRLDGTSGTTLFQDYSVNLSNNNAAFTSKEALNAVYVLREERQVSVDVNYPSTSFNMTAGTNDGSVGYFEGGNGSISNSILHDFIKEFSSDGSTINFLLEGHYILSELIRSSVVIDGISHMGYLDEYEEGKFRFVFEDETLPVFVNGQTYSIEINQYS